MRMRWMVVYAAVLTTEGRARVCTNRWTACLAPRSGCPRAAWARHTSSVKCIAAAGLLNTHWTPKLCGLPGICPRESGVCSEGLQLRSPWGETCPLKADEQRAVAWDGDSSMPQASLVAWYPSQGDHVAFQHGRPINSLTRRNLQRSFSPVLHSLLGTRASSGNFVKGEILTQ